MVADLSDWERYQPRKDQVAVDPELGRILFRSRASSRRKCGSPITTASARTWAAANTTGRPIRLPEPDKAVHGRRGSGRTSSSPMRCGSGARSSQATPSSKSCDSGVYSEQLSLELAARPGVDDLCSQRHAARHPPTRLPAIPARCVRDHREAGSSFTLDGVLVTGRPLRVSGPLRAAEAASRHAGTGLDDPPRLRAATRPTSTAWS